MKALKKSKRRPSVTRAVGYRYLGDIDIERAMRLLAKARDQGVVTEFDSNKSGSPGMDVVWFNGLPGRALRDLRASIAALVR